MYPNSLSHTNPPFLHPHADIWRISSDPIWSIHLHGHSSLTNTTCCRWEIGQHSKKLHFMSLYIQKHGLFVWYLGLGDKERNSCLTPIIIIILDLNTNSVLFIQGDSIDIWWSYDIHVHLSSQQLRRNQFKNLCPLIQSVTRWFYAHWKGLIHMSTMQLKWRKTIGIWWAVVPHTSNHGNSSSWWLVCSILSLKYFTDAKKYIKIIWAL